MSQTRLLSLVLVLSCIPGCATQLRTSGSDSLAVQIGVTETNPAEKAMRIADEHCAKSSKKAVFQSVRDQVIFEYVCR